MAHFIIKQNLWPQWNFIMSLTEQNTKPLKYFKQSKVQVYHTGYSCHPFFFSCYSYEQKWCFCDSYVKKKKWSGLKKYFLHLNLTVFLCGFCIDCSPSVFWFVHFCLFFGLGFGSHQPHKWNWMDVHQKPHAIKFLQMGLDFNEISAYAKQFWKGQA